MMISKTTVLSDVDDQPFGKNGAFHKRLIQVMPCSPWHIWKPSAYLRQYLQSIALKAVEILQSTCLHLTQGQYLDLSYESRDDLTIDDYWPMVEGKTAALIAASTELGALAAFCDDTDESYISQIWSAARFGIPGPG